MISCVVACVVMAPFAGATFLRLGPFDFAAETLLEGIYTTNVEGERPDETEEGFNEEQPDREDYYGVAGLALAANAAMTPQTVLTIDSAMAIEEHVNRPDLNNSSSPFGRLRLASVSQFRHAKIDLIGSIERTSESQDDVFVPGNRKKRDVQDMAMYGASISWLWKSASLGARYDFQRERHDDEDFQDGDQDETTLGFNAGLAPSRWFSITYDYERIKTEQIHPLRAATNGIVEALLGEEDDEEEDDEDNWKETETISLNAPIPLWRRPQITYSLGFERESDENETGDWEATHTISMGDDLPLLESRSFRLSANAAYTFENDEENDDINFTYGVTAEHDISRTLRHSLRLTREPVDTLGTDAETDSTQYDYTLTKNDLFIYNLNLLLNVSYSRNEPVGEVGELIEIENTLRYYASLEHRRALSRKLERSLMYSYEHDDSNLEAEPLEEHRVTLSFQYTF